MILGSVDPGRGSGLAVYRTDDGNFASWEQKDGLDLADLAGCSIIIYEIYTPTERTNETETMEHIGVIRKFCEQRGITCIGSPTSAKKFQKDEKLRALGWFVKTKDGHSNDAARHLLGYCLKNRLLTVEDMNRVKEVLR